jgi:hypothetical protein
VKTSTRFQWLKTRSSGSCEYGNELPECIKVRTFPGQLRDCPHYRSFFYTRVRLKKKSTFSSGTNKAEHNSAKLSPCSEMTICAVTQEPPSILWHPTVHHRIPKSPPLGSTISRINPVHTTSSYLTFILILSSHPHLYVTNDILSGFLSKILCSQ